MATPLSGTEGQYMIVRAFTYSKYHGKPPVGSTRLRVLQLMKYWPEYKEYQYGEKTDVMIFQKVYMQNDWKWPAKIDGIKILDICDPDWLDGSAIRETLDAMDGVTCPTKAMADFLQQMTDKPIKVIPDRHDIEFVPSLKKHTGVLNSAVWFGYSQNATLLKTAIPVIERLGLELTVISNDDPFVHQWADPKNIKNYHYLPFDESTILTDLAKYDVAILPQGNRPQDAFKSNNKTTLAWLAGLPVVQDAEQLEAMMKPDARNRVATVCYNKAIKDYDVKQSVIAMKGFIEELK